MMRWFDGLEVGTVIETLKEIFLRKQMRCCPLFTKRIEFVDQMRSFKKPETPITLTTPLKVSSVCFT